jgi:hypothetical protein
VGSLLTRAELAKLARTLGTGEDRVAFLAPQDPHELRALTRSVTDALFGEHRAAFQRLAEASRLLPASLVAKMSELVFGPMLSARIASAMPPARAVEVAEKLKTAFLAEVTMQLDPRSAAEVLAAMPVKVIVEVARALLRRGEFVTMGRFVDDLTDTAIRAVAGAVESDEALLRIAYFVERRERLVELVELLPPERLRGMITAAVQGPAELQQAGLAVIGQLSARQQGRVAELAIDMGAGALKALVAAVQRHGAGPILADVIGHVDEAGRRRFVKLLGAEAARALGLPTAS